MVKPLDYNSGLSLQEAAARYSEVVAEFEKVASHYTGLLLEGGWRSNAG